MDHSAHYRTITMEHVGREPSLLIVLPVQMEEVVFAVKVNYFYHSGRFNAEDPYFAWEDDNNPNTPYTGKLITEERGNLHIIKYEGAGHHASNDVDKGNIAFKIRDPTTGAILYAVQDQNMDFICIRSLDIKGRYNVYCEQTNGLGVIHRLPTNAWEYEDHVGDIAEIRSYIHSLRLDFMYTNCLLGDHDDDPRGDRFIYFTTPYHMQITFYLKARR